MLILSPQRLKVLLQAQRLRAYPILLVVLVVIVGVIGDHLIRGTPFLADEARHFKRVLRVREGDFRPDQFQTNMPGYYTLLAGLSWVTGSESLQDVRRISMCLSLCGVALVYGISRKLEPARAALVAAQFLFLPFLLPFQFLVYVDPFALVLFLLSLYYALEDCPVLSGCVACASVLTRQPQIVWMLFTFAVLYVERNGLRLGRQAVLQHLARCWVFLIGFAAFGLFVIFNEGVALGDRKMHPFGTIHTENVFLALFLCGVAFFPLHLANAPRMFAVVRRHPLWFAFGAFVTFGIYWMTLCGDHPYNQGSGLVFLRNGLLNKLKASDINRVLFFLPLCWVILSLAVTELKRPAFYLLYPFAVLFLVPSWLIEPRYTIPFLALFVLFRAFRSLTLEWANLGWSAAVASFLFVGTANRWFFL